MKYVIKKHLKRILSLIMVLILLLGAFAGCGDANSDDKDVIPPLSAEKELEFKEIFYNKYKDNYPTTTIDDIKVRFLGEFEGSYAVIFETGIEVYMPDFYEVINGFEFVYPDTQPMNIAHDGELYRLEEAYNMGLITDEDLSVLFKRYRPTCNATVNDEFSTKTIILGVMPSSNFKEYTPKDFSEVNCIEVRELFNDKMYVEGELGRFLVLTVRSYSKKTILKYIKELEQRDDIYDASPDYMGGID